MIGPDDIEAFEASNSEALDAANEYARRAQKNIPCDRWADGAEGALLVARGIHAMQKIMLMQNAALEAVFEDMQARGADAMRLHTACSKYAAKAEQ